MGAVDELVENGSVAFFLKELLILPQFHASDWAVNILKTQLARILPNICNARWSKAERFGEVNLHYPYYHRTYSVPDLKVFSSRINGLSYPFGGSSNCRHIP